MTHFPARPEADALPSEMLNLWQDRICPSETIHDRDGRGLFPRVFAASCEALIDCGFRSTEFHELRPLV